MHMRLLRSVVLLLTLVVAAAAAQAGKPKTVREAFAGQVVISATPLRPSGETEAEMIADIRAAQVHQIASRETGDDDVSWTFFFTAFLDRQPRTSEMSLDVYAADGDKRYITSKRMMGIDPRLQILGSDMTLSAEDGVEAGGRYRLALTGQVGNREVTFATAVVTLR